MERDKVDSRGREVDFRVTERRSHGVWRCGYFWCGMSGMGDGEGCVFGWDVGGGFGETEKNLRGR